MSSEGAQPPKKRNTTALLLVNRRERACVLSQRTTGFRPGPRVEVERRPEVSGRHSQHRGQAIGVLVTGLFGIVAGNTAEAVRRTVDSQKSVGAWTLSGSSGA